MASNQIKTWSKGICVNFKPVLSLRCWSDSTWTKGDSGGVYMAALSRYAGVITSVSSSEHSRVEPINLKAWLSVVWGLPAVWKLSICCCLFVWALEPYKRVKGVFWHFQTGEDFVVEKQWPKQIKSSFHAYTALFWWQKLLDHTFLKSSFV